MGLARTLLLALGYPHAHSFTHADERAFRALVAWLENAKIRHYAVEARSRLGSTQDAAWPDAFAQYLRDLECPVEAAAAATSRQAVLEWLLSFAVGLEYGDDAEQYARDASLLQEQHSKAAAAGLQPFPDIRSREVQQQLAALFQLLHVNTSSGTLDEQLEAAREVLADSVLPSLTDASVQHSVAAGNMQHVPLGFETGDSAVDRLATLLRLLYIRDLRQLQTAIDRMVVQVQELTANPRTDASLGRVGH